MKPNQIFPSKISAGQRQQLVVTPLQVLISFSQHLMILNFFIDHTGLSSVNITSFRAATISLKLKAICFDIQFIISVIFSSKHCWFQLLKCEDLLRFFAIYESMIRVFGFRTVGWKKQPEDVLLGSGKLWWAFKHENWFIEINDNSCRPNKYLLYPSNLLWIMCIGIPPFLHK